MISVFKKSRRRSKRGISEVISTTIMTAAILSIVLSTFAYASYVLSIESASSEFTQAQGLMLSFNNMLRDVTLRENSRAFLRFSFRTSGPNFVQTGQSITVNVSQTSGHFYTPLSASPISVFRIKGGTVVGTSNSTLMGSGSILLTEPASILGRVTVNQSNGAWITLDYARVKINYLGLQSFYNGTGLENYNIVEIMYLNFTRGSWSGSNILTISAANIGVKSTQLPIFSKTNPITFKVTGGWPTSQSMTTTLIDLGGDPSKRTLVRTVFVNMELSVAGS